jgi:lysozyme family protein
MTLTTLEDYPRFKKALDFVFKQEGIYSNDPDDMGGETKYGISKRSHPELDIASLTRQDAEEIYYEEYWSPLACDMLDYRDALLVFDSAVQHGVARTFEWAKEIENWHDLIEVRRNFYKEIIENNPSQRKFERGWNNRLAKLENEYAHSS